MKENIRQLVAEALQALDPGLVPEELRPSTPEVERARDQRHGDFACNVALQIARAARCNPRQLAAAIVAALPPSESVAEVSIAGPGFINFRLSELAYHRELERILEAGPAYGHSELGTGHKVLVEFVSANPTGPLHVGHGRHAAYGATVANLLAAVGHTVEREYYVNDAGRQTDILALSVWLRYLELAGDMAPDDFPAAGYRGDYIREIAAAWHDEVGREYLRPVENLYSCLPPDHPDGNKDAHIDALISRARLLLDDDGFKHVLDHALEGILGDIRDDLAEFGVHPDRWFRERSLGESGAIDRALDLLRKRDLIYERDGAQWFRATDFGDEKDRVVIRENGQTTYFASDIAYHLHKRERGHELLLDVLGADHHGYVARVRAGLEAMGEPGECLEVRLVQFVALYRGGEKMPMSTRSGQFITLRQLRREVGNDAARFFYVLRSNDQHLEFDLELAKSRSRDNPVYYIQYAHARVCSLLRKLGERGWSYDQDRGRGNLQLLTESAERKVMTSLSRYPEIVESAAINRAPHTLIHYLRDLANEFHTCYQKHKVLQDDETLRDARMTLALASRQVVRNGLDLLGVSAPEAM